MYSLLYFNASKRTFKNTRRFFVQIPCLRNNVLYFLKHTPNVFKKDLVLIYSSSDSSEEEKSLYYH